MKYPASPSAKQKAKVLINDFGSKADALKCIEHILLAGITPIQKQFYREVRAAVNQSPEKQSKRPSLHPLAKPFIILKRKPIT